MADCIWSMIFFMTLSFLIWVEQDPCHNAVLGGLWSIKNRWAPYNFFRLFCTSRTCTPKSEKAPFKWNVGSKNIFQSQTRQGPHSFKNSNTFEVVFLSREIRKNIYICPLLIQTKYDRSGNKTTCYNFQPSFVDKLYPFTATSSVCIRLADFLEISNNKSEWLFFSLIFSLAILSAAIIKVASLFTDDLLEYWVSILVTSFTRWSATSFALLTSDCALNV